MTDLADLLSISVEVVFAGVFLFLRVGTFALLLPGFGEQSIPARLRLMVGLAMTLAILPMRPEAPAPLGLAALTVGMAEIASGAILGLGLRFALFALQTAGTMAAQATSLAQLLGNAGAEPMPAIGHVLSLGGLALLMSTGFPIAALRYVLASYDSLPLGQWAASGVLAPWGIGLAAHSFAQAFQLAMPFFLVSVLYNLALGAINRAMPQLMVALVGAPFISWSAIALLMVTAGPILLVWADGVVRFLALPPGQTP